MWRGDYSTQFKKKREVNFTKNFMDLKHSRKRHTSCSDVYPHAQTLALLQIFVHVHTNMQMDWAEI